MHMYDLITKKKHGAALTDEEIAFMKAMDDYKRKSGRQFPTWSEVLEVLRSLGYRQVAEPVEISGR